MATLARGLRALFNRVRGRPDEIARLELIIANLTREADTLALPTLGLPKGFDSFLYLWRNPDVAASGDSPVLHYLQYGHREGRVWTGPPIENRLVQELHDTVEVTQIFDGVANDINSISIALLPARTELPSSISLELFETDGERKLVSAASWELPATASILTLNFDPIPDSAGRRFLLKASSSSNSQSARELLLSSAEDRIAGHNDCFIGPRNLQAFGLAARIGYVTKLTAGSLPQRILYSPVTQCNLNCIHCISKETRKTVARMSQSIKDQIRAWCGAGQVEEMATDYSGDLLWADHRWPGELDDVLALGVPFHIDTNGAYLTEERAKKLINSTMTSLNVPLDAAEDESHQRIRRGTPGLGPVLENVRRFSILRQAASVPKTIELSLGFTLMRSNLDQLIRFIEIGLETGVDVIYCRHVEAYEAALESESLWFEKKRFNAVRAEAVAFAARRRIRLSIPEPFTDEVSTSGHKQCEEPWRSVVILGNGDVQFCCVPTTKIGNLHEEPMEEIWSGPRYQAFRSAVNSDKPPAQCDACPMFRRESNINSYLPHRTMPNWTEPYSWPISSTSP